MPSIPEISVIIPVYNVEKYLRRCIDSVLKQTFKNFECILVDDGSPDGSGKICDEYALKDSRICVIHKKNGGVSSARNAGLDRAKAEFISFIDSDDFIDSIMFEKLLESQKESKADLTATGAKYGRSGFFHLTKCLMHTEENIEWPAVFNSSWGKLYKRYIIEENHLRFEEGKSYGEDTVFNYSYLSDISSVCCIEGDYYNYFKNPASICHNLTKKIILTNLEIISHLDAYIAKKGRTKDFEIALFAKKFEVKCAFIFLTKKPDFNLFRTSFPEINGILLERSKSKKQRFLFKLILQNRDFTATLIYYLYRPVSKIRTMLKEGF